MANEYWRSIPGFEGSYKVSTQGRIRSLDRKTDRGRKWRGRIMTPTPMNNGYMKVTLWRSGKQTSHLLHRLVLMTFRGVPDDGMEGMHRDGDRANNALSNLAWGTHSDNQWDQVAHGTHRHASKTHCVNGHQFTEDNTYLYPNQFHRACRTCRKQYGQNFRENRQRVRAVA